MQPPTSTVRLLEHRPSVYAWLVALMSGLAFVTGTAPDVFPGDSANLVAQHTGIEPFAPLTHILWGWAGNLFALLPLGSLGYRWNLFSAVCGAASCGVLTLLAGRLVGYGRDADRMTRHPPAMRNLGALVAGFLLAFCLPFRIVSTIAHPATFELLLLLVSTWLLARFAGTGRLRDGIITCAFFGMTASQYTTALMLAPVFLCFLAYILWRRTLLRTGPVAVMLGVAAAAFALLPLVTMWRFSQSPGFLWSDMKDVGDILYYLAKDTYTSLRYGTPKVAITIVGLFSLVPFFAVVLMQRSHGFGSRILMTLCLAIGILLFYNVRFAPWPMFGFRPLLVMPYVIAALWLSYLVAVSISALLSSWSIQQKARRDPRIRGRVALACAGVTALLVAGAGVASQRAIDTTSALFVTKYADAVVQQINDGMWVVVDTRMEPLIRIKAHERGINPLILSAQRFNHRPYQHAIAEQLGDARLGSMAEMGLIPLLRERLEPSRRPAPVIAVPGDPGILRFIAGKAYPDRTLYLLQEEDPLPENWDAYMETRRTWWSQLPVADQAGPFGDLVDRINVQSARIANDTGVWLEEQVQVALAREAYKEAMRIHPKNLSAHLNLRATLPEHDPEVADLELSIESLSAPLRGKATLVQIMDLDGQIRHEAARRSAQKRWEQVDPSEQLDDRMNALLSIDDDQEVIRRVAGQHDMDHAFRLNLARIAAGKKRLDLARGLLDSIQATGQLSRVVLFEKAGIDVQQGQAERAYNTLISVPESEMNDPRPLILLASLTAESRPQDCDRYLEQLEIFPNLLVSLELPIARIYASRNNRAMALRHLSKLVALQPLNKDALHLMTRIHLDDGDVTGALKPAKQLLVISSRDPVANAALALHLASKGQDEASAQAREIALSGNPVLSVYFDK